jgi:cyclopropane-fatty-acyl-phospholipid synthase
MSKHSIGSDRQAISRHYDVSNDFYRLFLGKGKLYSCAYFKTGAEDLDEAQANKLDHLCRKLRLRPGEKLLDIGCGWGGLVAYAARYYGVSATGVTISRRQHEYAQAMVEREGLSRTCRVELQDYRQIAGEGCFDKIVSVGMFEHVGTKNLPVYFKTASRLLKNDGLFLNHGITAESHGRRGSAATKFINKYVFPDGELTSLSRIMSVVEAVNFEALDVESLREHYAKTLKLWTLNLQADREKAIALAGEKVYRAWILYMAGSAWGFEKGNINVYQVLLAKRSGGFPPVPLTRADIYRAGF